MGIICESHRIGYAVFSQRKVPNSIMNAEVDFYRILDVALAKCQRATKNKYEFGT